jgi:hypothetical protein
MTDPTPEQGESQMNLTDAPGIAFRGAVGPSEHEGYLRLFVTKDRQEHYDIPMDWICGIVTARIWATRTGANGALRGGNPQPKLGLDQLWPEPDVGAVAAPRGIDPIT